MVLQSTRRLLEAIDLPKPRPAERQVLIEVPPATVISVNEFVRRMRALGKARGVPVKAFPGLWQDVARAVPTADVVVCHHVVYNVADLRGFAAALSSHARRRVVVELTARHPVVSSNPLWKHFWGIDRPEGPKAEDAVAVLAEAGIEPGMERETRPPARSGGPDAWAAFTTRRLCLPPERQPEVEEAMARWPEPPEREYVTLWWDGGAEG